MPTLLFIPSLLSGDYHAFMVKLSVMLFAWLLVPSSSIIDLITGIAASKRLGTKRTTSWGLRRTLSKLLQFFALFLAMLLLDIGTSVLSPFVTMFSVPILSGLTIVAEISIEVLSIKENIQKGRTPEEDKIDDIAQLATKVVEAVGYEKAQKVLEALKLQIDDRKA